MKKYLLIIMISLSLTACLESRKAGDVNRQNIDILAEFLKRNHPSPEADAFKEKTKHDLENVPKVVDGQAIVNGIRTGVEIVAPAVGSIFGIPPLVYMPIVATILKGAEVIVNKNKKIAETKQKEEINKLLPIESHEAYAEAKATVIANGGVAVPVVVPPPKV